MPFDLSVPLQYHGLLSTVGIRDIVDILLVAVILYKSYEMLKDTRAITLAKGLFVMMGVALAAYILELHAIYWLLSKSIYLLFMALPIVFQPVCRPRKSVLCWFWSGILASMRLLIPALE